MSAENAKPRRKRGLLIAVTAAFALGALAAAALLVNITQRKQEAKQPYVRLTEVTENDVDPAKWGTNWPREYDGYKRTSEPSQTKYGGSGGAEGMMPPQKAARDPWLTRIFAGYLFAIDFRDRRGHSYMLFDQENTKRNVPAENKQSGNCMHCHASIMPLYRKLGKEAAPQASEAEQIQKGLEKVGELSYWETHKQLEQTTGRSRWSCASRGPGSSRASRSSPPRTRPSRTFRASSAGGRAIARRLTTPTWKRAGARSGPTCAASATWSTSAARGRPCSSRGVAD